MYILTIPDWKGITSKKFSERQWFSALSSERLPSKSNLQCR